MNVRSSARRKIVPQHAESRNRLLLENLETRYVWRINLVLIVNGAIFYLVFLVDMGSFHSSIAPKFLDRSWQKPTYLCWWRSVISKTADLQFLIYSGEQYTRQSYLTRFANNHTVPPLRDTPLSIPITNFRRRQWVIFAHLPSDIDDCKLRSISAVLRYIHLFCITN